MATPVFPSYATILLTGYSQKRESALMRTEMESGPPKQAKVKTKPMVVRAATILLKSKSDLAAFEAWYVSEINEGSSWFTFTDPITKATTQARIRDGGYTAAPSSGDAAAGTWQIQLQIETWG